MEHQLDATITVFIVLQDQLNMFRANFCPSSSNNAQKPCLPTFAHLQATTLKNPAYQINMTLYHML
jgi:hypothetical protein